MIRAKLRKGDPRDLRDAAHSPHMEALRGQVESSGDIFDSDRVDQGAINVFMSGHAPFIHAALIAGKHGSLLEIHGNESLTVNMGNLAVRIRQRYEELGLTQAEAAKASGCSTARFGNYVTQVEANRRKPDLDTLARIARALRTTTDWLLGLSEVVPVDAQAVILRLLELEGMPRERAEVIATAAEEALRLLSALPDEGDARTRALLAAQAAWQMKPSAKPS